MSGDRRILFLVNALENDAPTRLAIAMAKEMQERGWQTELVAWSRGSASGYGQSQTGLTATVLGKGWIRNAALLRRMIRRHRPHIIHTALVRPTLGLLFTKLLGVKTDFFWVAWNHGVHEWGDKGLPASLMLNRLMPLAYELSDHVITVSQDARKRLAARGVSSGKITVISNGADATSFYPRPREKRAELVRELFGEINPAEVLLVGSAGNLRYIKGYDLLLLAAAEAHSRDPRFRFVIWGEGPERAGLEACRDRNDLTSVVALPGYSSTLKLQMSLLDFYVQPSRDESFGLAAVEAMMSGVPAVLADTGGLTEVAGGGKAARLYPANEPGALANHLLDLASRPVTREKLAKAGRLFALEYFTQKRMADQMEQFYLSCMENR